jgi:tetratricopeptide (TPR) repeat protein
MFNYYKDWDKFADEALAELDKESDSDNEIGDGFIQAKKPTFVDDGPLSQAQMMQRTSGAKPNTKVVIKGGTIKKNSLADQLKAEGNGLFASLDYDKAIEKYTRCIPEVPESDHTLRTVVFSNRAQCYLKLKKYESAYLDADRALQYDPSHLKSI